MRHRHCSCGCNSICRGKYKVGHRPVVAYRATKEGRIHRLRAKHALGKPLPKGVHVHHVDLTKNEHSALVICEDQKYHKLLHLRTRILRSGGNPNTDSWCSYCGPKRKSEFHSRSTGRLLTICKECNKEYVKEWKRKQRNGNVRDVLCG